MTAVHAEISDSLVCPLCHSRVEATDDSIVCTGTTCGRAYPVKNGIPVMLTGGESPEDEDSGFYPKILGGTMEDNPNPVFANYDAGIRSHYLKKYLEKETTDGPILDICCSKAPFYPYLKEWGFEGKVFGADLLFHQLETASERGVNAVQANALHLPFEDGYFTHAIFTDALVHLLRREDQEGVLNEIARVLKPGGALFMTATNLSFVAVNSLITGHNALKSDYCTYYSRQEIVDLTIDKYRIESHDAFGFYYLIPSILRRTTGILYVFDRLANNRLTRKLGIVNFFKLRRVEDS